MGLGRSHNPMGVQCLVAGVFAYRHLGLVGRNIVLMKRFLPLLIVYVHRALK